MRIQERLALVNEWLPFQAMGIITITKNLGARNVCSLESPKEKKNYQFLFNLCFVGISAEIGICHVAIFDGNIFYQYGKLSIV